MEISDSSSKEDVEVALLRQSRSFFRRFSLARFFRSFALTKSLAQARQRRNDAKNTNYYLDEVSEEE